MNRPSAPPATGLYNVAVDLLGRNLSSKAQKIAFIDAEGTYTYADVAGRADCVGGALLGSGLKAGERVALILLDGIDFVASFLGAIQAGLVPIPLNTLFPSEDYAYILKDSDAKAAIVSAPLLSQVAPAIAQSGWTGLLIISGVTDQDASLKALMARAPAKVEAHPTRADDIAFWLYSSGSTGRPKGAPHRHASPVTAAALFAMDTFGLRETDVVYSAAKLFFAYGIGNGLVFPMAVGATAVLYPDRVVPEAVGKLLAEHAVTVFCGVPTLYGAILESPHAPTSNGALRICMSAGEALPEALGRAWAARTGTDIVDGVGSTEMLHIYVSNRPGAVRYGATGRPVKGYAVKLVDEGGATIEGEGMGELYVRGPTMTVGYWNQPEKTAATFADGWMRTGDKFLRDAEGLLTHCGRADDMLKVSGIWVSPVEVENALLAHEAVLEAAVIGVTDPSGLVKTKAFVVARPGFSADAALAQALKAFTKSRLAPYKYPRVIEFIDHLPKTATGKIRRHVLRERETAASRPSGAAA